MQFSHFSLRFPMLTSDIFLGWCLYIVDDKHKTASAPPHIACSLCSTGMMTTLAACSCVTALPTPPSSDCPPTSYHKQPAYHKHTSLMLGRREAVIKNPMAHVNYRHNNDNENCIETLNSHKAHYITSCLYKEEGVGG